MSKGGVRILHPFFDNIGKESDQKQALNDAHGRLGALEFSLQIPCFSNTKIAINPFKIAGTRYNNFRSCAQDKSINVNFLQVQVRPNF